ncbi:pentapeptide repeat-containing protein [Kutzneria sp. CA-103260]|uniref:pentapeptide repeat-containing protein n=1 Tax=Kutzneria sp. CA-103260 TaxID=2802641 RepID=UPI001BF0AB20|nr:pentapeptide repeat-containing protein [Kutzneria sp. CA-103260]
MTDDLRADCSNCFALCCVALPFTASADFAITKNAGTPCRNLLADHRCGIHTDLRAKGFPGCTVFDCFGAGQKVSQTTFGGAGWREAPAADRRHMFDAFTVMLHLHELLWYLAQARTLAPARSLHARITAAYEQIEQITLSTSDTLLAVDIPAHRKDVNELLLKASELTRATVKGKKPDRRGADLMGAKLKDANLAGANLRSAYLIAADLRGADLRLADVIGADFRDADLRGADLSDTLFLTQSQINAARGDAATRIPDSVHRPAHWSSAAGK